MVARITAYLPQNQQSFFHKCAILTSRTVMGNVLFVVFDGAVMG
jgi:hypothetical protein